MSNQIEDSDQRNVESWNGVMMKDIDSINWKELEKILSEN